jgi:hypothetical protein
MFIGASFDIAASSRLETPTGLPPKCRHSRLAVPRRLSPVRLDPVHLDRHVGRGWRPHFSLAGFAGRTVTLPFTGTEDSSNQTSFVVDDTAINVT